MIFRQWGRNSFNDKTGVLPVMWLTYPGMDESMPRGMIVQSSLDMDDLVFGNYAVHLHIVSIEGH